jgi:hypothetical protein
MILSATDAKSYFDSVLNRYRRAEYPNEVFNKMVDAAIVKFIDDRIDEAGTDSRRIQQLSVLTQPPLIITNSGLSVPDSESFVLPLGPAPEKYYRALNVGFNRQYVNDPCFGNQFDATYCVATKQDGDIEYSVSQNPFRKPAANKDKMYWVQFGNTIKPVMGATCYARNLRLFYIKTPVMTSIQTNTIQLFPDKSMYDVMDIAVSIFLGSVDSPRTAFSNKLNQFQR